LFIAYWVALVFYGEGEKVSEYVFDACSGVDCYEAVDVFVDAIESETVDAVIISA
jgi:hypothetical protein